MMAIKSAKLLVRLSRLQKQATTAKIHSTLIVVAKSRAYVRP